jgi:gamma-glutamyltranspeptidase/glutathione hydrolase
LKQGETASMIDRDLAAHNCIIRYDDLQDYSAVEREPAMSIFRGNQILSMPPPSSGGVALRVAVAEKLRGMGYAIDAKLRSQGDVHAVMVEDGSGWRLGWSDGHRGGRAAGY